jgi:urease accessory protein
LPYGSSQLRFARRGERTVLVSSQTELPLIVQRPLRGPAGQAVLVLLTPAGALFDGDVLRLDVRCGEDTDVTLTTAAATKLNRCDRGLISFDVHLAIGRGATLRYLPHELIPFQGARYRQRIDVDVEDDASGWLLEVVTPGASEARFRYTSLDFETNVRHDGTLMARERFGMTPASAAHMRDHSHYGSTYDRTAAAALNERLACVPLPTVAAASALPTHGMLLKMLGSSAQSVRDTLLTSAGCPGWLTSTLPP